PALENLFVVGRTFDAAVPGAIVVRPVLVVLAVRGAVLLVVRHKVAQGEPVVGGDEVDAVVGPAAAGLVEIGAAGQPVPEVAERPGFAAAEVAHGVTESAVPLRPQRWEVADLVPALADIPRLGDELDLP